MQVCCVTGKPRSGTTVLKKMLASHPEIVDFGEVFRETGEDSFFGFLRDSVAKDGSWMLPSRRVEIFLKYIEDCKAKAKSYKKDASTLVIDVKYDQTHLVYDAWRDMNALPVFFDVIKKNGWHVVDLRRQSIVSMIISNEIAISTNVYHSDLVDRDYQADIKIRLDPNTLEHRIRGIRATYERVGFFFKDYPRYKSFFYEDLFDHQTGAFKPDILEALSSLLGLDNRFDPQPALRKLLGTDALSYVENADEIGALLDRLNLSRPGR